MTLSQKRKHALLADGPVVERVYAAACERFGVEAVAKDLGLVWTFRCMQGMQNVLPFSDTVSQTWGEFRYVLQEVCGLPDGEPHCYVTGHRCGTDTWTVGHPCPCVACQRWVQGQAAPGEG